MRRRDPALTASWLAVAFALVAAGCARHAPCDSAWFRDSDECVDVAIVTIIPEEYRAMLSKLTPTIPLEPACPECANQYAWVGARAVSNTRDAPLRIVVGMAGEAGTTSGALVAARAIERFRPRYLLLVGVAGGMPPHVRQGDVVVATSIWGYDYGAIDEAFRPRQDFSFRSDQRLLAAARELEASWQSDITSESPDPERVPTLKVGQVGSGNKVIENIGSTFTEAILSVNPDIVGVEMEGAGVAAAIEGAKSQGISVGFLMVRGISDVPRPLQVFGDKPDRERWKRYAADAAASFTLSMIRNSWPKSP